MATNLRLSESAAAAVRREAERTGRSQQDVIRAAVDAYLAPPSQHPRGSFRDQLIPPERPFETVPFEERLKLPEGVTSLDLLDREDRLQPPPS